MPLLAGFLAIFHLVFFAPVISVAATTEGVDYTCNKKFQVRFALFGILATYLVCALNEIAIMLIGLRGGPLEERKRRAMRPLLYLEVVLWVVILALTVYATYVGASPSIHATCWSDNPCNTIDEVVPSACTVSKGGDIALTKPCALIVAESDLFQRVCWVDWFDYAATVRKERG